MTICYNSCLISNCSIKLSNKSNKTKSWVTFCCSELKSLYYNSDVELLRINRINNRIMRRTFVIFLLLLSFSINSYSETCRKCHGTGNITIFSGKTGNYGLDPIYRKCPICHKTVDATLSHKHDCPQCGRKGWVNSSKPSSSSSSSTGGTYNDNLTIAERNYVNALIREMVAPNIKTIECSTCHGTGICQSCQGRGYITVIGRNIVCPLCNGWHPEKGCSQCHGFGNVTIKEKKTQTEIDEINNKIRKIHQDAIDRAIKQAIATYQ